jgi:hypothetical protein
MGAEGKEEDDSADADGTGPHHAGVFRAYFTGLSRQHAACRAPLLASLSTGFVLGTPDGWLRQRQIYFRGRGSERFWVPTLLKNL